MRFAAYEYFYWLLLIPLIVAGGVVSLMRRLRNYRRVADPKLFELLAPEASLEREILRLVLVVLACVSLVIALARPQFGTQTREIKRRGVDVVVALDASKSMLAQDVSPSGDRAGNRLKRAKLEVSGLIDRLEGDRFGLVAFSGVAFVQCPLTTDYAAAKLLLRAVEAGTIPVGGTRFSEALRASRELFENAKGGARSRVLILISDGEDHEGGYEEELKNLKSMGVVIHTVGVGSMSGELIPQENDDQKYLRKDGKWVWTYLRDATLRGIADSSGGLYIYSATGDLGFEAIYDVVSRMQKSEFESKIESVYDDKFQLFAWIGWLLLVAATVVPQRREVSRS